MEKTDMKQQKNRPFGSVLFFISAVPTGIEPAERNYKDGSRWNWFIVINRVFFTRWRQDFTMTCKPSQAVYEGLSQNRDRFPLMSQEDLFVDSGGW